jgi:putative hemolysin
MFRPPSTVLKNKLISFNFFKLNFHYLLLNSALFKRIKRIIIFTSNLINLKTIFRTAYLIILLIGLFLIINGASPILHQVLAQIPGSKVKICRVPQGDPRKAHIIEVEWEDWEKGRIPRGKNGLDFVVEKETDCENYALYTDPEIGEEEHKVLVCHIPGGKWERAYVVEITREEWLSEKSQYRNNKNNFAVTDPGLCSGVDPTPTPVVELSGKIEEQDKKEEKSPTPTPVYEERGLNTDKIAANIATPTLTPTLTPTPQPKPTSITDNRVSNEKVHVSVGQASKNTEVKVLGTTYLADTGNGHLLYFFSGLMFITISAAGLWRFDKVE